MCGCAEHIPPHPEYAIKLARRAPRALDNAYAFNDVIIIIMIIIIIQASLRTRSLAVHRQL